MIWLTWRQHRMPGLAGAAAIGLLAAGLLYVAIRTRQVADALGLPLTDSGVLTVVQGELGQNALLGAMPIVALFLTSFIGVVSGAALFSREFEERTHRLVWTQGISRERWFFSKVVIVAAALTGGTALVALVAALSAPALPALVASSGRFSSFDMELPVLLAWTLFAFALGLLFGALTRRGVASLLATLIAYVAARAFVTSALRPYYQPPIQVENRAQIPADAWAFPHRWADAAGREVDGARVSALIRDFGAQAAAYQGRMDRYLADNGIFSPILYQPADRFWAFQGIETALVVGIALVCVLSAFVLIRRARP